MKTKEFLTMREVSETTGINIKVLRRACNDQGYDMKKYTWLQSNVLEQLKVFAVYAKGFSLRDDLPTNKMWLIKARFIHAWFPPTFNIPKQGNLLLETVGVFRRWKGIAVDYRVSIIGDSGAKSITFRIKSTEDKETRYLIYTAKLTWRGVKLVAREYSA